MSRVLLFLLAFFLLSPVPARAYTPESGLWWNPAESGTGYTFDLQDNFIGMTMYMYRTDGQPDWYISNGFLQGNSVFEGTVMRFENGMCFGCAWRRNNFDRDMGSVRVVFNANDPTRAIMTLGGRTFPIERYQFYLKRAEDGAASIRLTKMLGEWSTTIDLSSVADSGSYPFSGDILVFDQVDLSQSPGFFDGCRPDNGQDAYCSTQALAWHSASGYYDSDDRRHVIVVDDSPNYYAMYVLQVGTNDLRGTTAIYPKGTNPVRFYPVRGFRTASRTFVEEGVGPAMGLEATPKQGGGAGLGSLLEALGASNDDAAELPTPMGDPVSLNAIRAQLEQRLEAKR